MKRYIYKITNLINGKIYIGQTKNTLERRLKEHIWEAKRWYNNVDKKFNSKLFSAIIKYGEENFIVEPIYELRNSENIDELERYYIRQLDAMNEEKGYNISEGGNKPPTRKNFHQSLEARQKMSDSQKGKSWYNDGYTEIMVFKNDIPPANFVRGRLAGRGFKTGTDNPSHKQKGIKGKPMSESTKLKLSQTKKKNNKLKNKIWFNNGYKEIQINTNSNYVIPEGYKKGRLISNMNTRIPVKIIDVTSNTETIYESCSAACVGIQTSIPTLIKANKTGRLINNRYKCIYIDNK